MRSRFEKWMSQVWGSVRHPFLNVPWQRDDPFFDNDVDEDEKRRAEAWARGTKLVEMAWSPARQLVDRGNAAGAIASLTLFGSQTVSAAGPKADVFWATAVFILGLGLTLVRHAVSTWQAKVRREGMVMDAEVLEGFDPAPAFDFAITWTGRLAVLALAGGVIWGIVVLYSLSHPS